MHYSGHGVEQDFQLALSLYEVRFIVVEKQEGLMEEKEREREKRNEGRNEGRKEGRKGGREREKGRKEERRE